MTTIPEEILENLISLANKDLGVFDPNEVHNYVCGREDAYVRGMDKGKVLYARELLDSLGVDWSTY